MPSVQIRLLGQFRFVYQNEPVLISRTRLQSLLGYLAMHRDAPQLRQHLAFLFWPDSTEVHARNSLRKLLYDLRHEWPDTDAVLAIDHAMVYWRNPASVMVDVAAFTRSLATAEPATTRGALQGVLEKAVALYTGELLPACYDDWVVRQRERLHQQYLDALERLSQLCAEQGDQSAALSYAQQLVQADPLQESAYRLIMHLYMGSHDRAHALRVYHTCATILARELGVDPGPETQAVYQHLLNMEESTAPVVPTVLLRARSLVGRQREWEKLLRVWQQAAGGEPHFVAIAGEAGIGKSRLAEEMMLWANERGIPAVQARAYAAEGSLAYAPVRDWLHSDTLRGVLAQLDPIWLTEIGRLLPELFIQRPELPRPEPVVEQWHRQQLFEALAQAFSAAKSPLLLVLDDLQWCDREMLEWLHYLLRFDPKARLLIVGTVRSEEVDPQHALTMLLLNLRSTGQVTEIELGPLNAGDTAQLALQVAEWKLDAEAASRLYHVTEGNPLFVVETVNAGFRSFDPEREDAERSLASHFYVPSPKVQAVIQSRLAQLSPVARDLARLAATIGREFRVDVLARASELDEETLVRGLDELWQRRIVREHDTEAYDFSHDRIREAAYSDVSLVRRRLLHRRVAEALEQVHAADLDAVSGQIAVHFELAGVTENAVLYYAVTASVAKRVWAHSEAKRYLNKALALLHKLPVTQEHLRQELQLQLNLGASMTMLKESTPPELYKVYMRAQALAAQVGDDQERLVAVAGLHTVELARGQLQAAYEWAMQCFTLAHQIGDPAALIEACNRMGVLLFHMGQYQASRGWLEQALIHKEYRWEFPTHLYWTHHQGVGARRMLSLVLWHLGYPDQAEQQMNKSLELLKEITHPYTVASNLIIFALLHYLRGESSLAQAFVEQAKALSQQHRVRNFFIEIMEEWALAQQGQAEEAIARMQEKLAIQSSKGLRAFKPTYLAILAKMHSDSGQLEEGLWVLDEALRLSAATGEHNFDTELHRLKAELLHMQGASEHEVEACLLQALTIARRQEAKSLELRTCISLSRLWQRQGKRQQAHDLLAGITAWFTEGFDTHDLKEAAAFLESLS